MTVINLNAILTHDQLSQLQGIMLQADDEQDFLRCVRAFLQPLKKHLENQGIDADFLAWVLTREYQHWIQCRKN